MSPRRKGKHGRREQPGRVPEAQQPTAAAQADNPDALAAHDPAGLPLTEKPSAAPGGIAGRASDDEREDKVTAASDDSFPASDPPAH